MAQPPSFAHFSSAPIYNTKAVARETGVPADTFRAWERRYHVPQPQRTVGGHRLYSERDIMIIRWLRDRTSEGMNISQAVQLMHAPTEPEASPAEQGARGFERLIEDLAWALTHFDAPHAERRLSEAFGIYPFEDVLLGLVQPTLIEIGERWQRGEIDVAAEHFASQYIRSRLSSLLRIFEGGSPHATVLAACAPQEQHDLGLLLVALFMVRRGWNVVYLGAQVPRDDLLAAVRSVKPDLVCLSATTAETGEQLAEVAQALAETFPQLRLGYGGRAFLNDAALRDRIPGVFLGRDAREAVEGAARLLVHTALSSSMQEP